MATARRPFRIEGPAVTPAGNEAPQSLDLAREILAEVASLRQLFDGHRTPAPDAAAAGEDGLRAVRGEIDDIHRAIHDTKAEIATLHFAGLKSRGTARVTDELDAVVLDTQQATEQILSSAEGIEGAAALLAGGLDGERGRLVSDIQDQVAALYEACNFQDITGQRIAKVVAALRFVEERVQRMMDIWGGVHLFAAPTPPPRSGDDALLNGPSLAGDGDVASQAEIDALFS